MSKEKEVIANWKYMLENGHVKMVDSSMEGIRQAVPVTEEGKNFMDKIIYE